MKPELGTKRVCPTTGRKFYDLNKDPIVSPYTGEAIPRSVFEPLIKGRAAPEKARPVDTESEAEETEDVEIISLEDADDEGSGNSSTKRNDANIDADDDLDEDISTDDDDDTFLADDEDDGDDVSDLIEGDLKDDEEP